ncbi:MAG: hypothetical protein KGL39_31100 [Patescibacteria group bacterium]|nr:hypothetical protein [Patescibacteria group bacterium]
MTYRVTYDEDADGRSILRYSGDAQGLIDACAKEARDAREHGRFTKRPHHMRKIMSVDPVVMMDIAHKTGLDYFDPAVFEILKGRDYSKFRTVDDRRLWRGK